MHDKIGWVVVLPSAEVRIQDLLGTSGVPRLSIDRGTGHVWDHGVSTTPAGVRRGSEWVVLWCWLWEPDVTTVATELAALESLGDVLLDDDGTTSGVDEPRACDCQQMQAQERYAKE